MAMNITEVRLCAVPLENDYKHTIWFQSATLQRAYFIGKSVHSVSNFSYQRKERVIRYPKHFDELQNCNYLMYKNSAYSDKYFYGFITDMEYINDEMTAIHFELDVLQSYMFNEDGSRGYTVQPSFIEREHVSDDSVGKHTIPENLECGEFICNWTQRVSDLYNTRIVIATTQDAEGISRGGQTQNGIYSGLQYWACPLDAVAKLNSFINMYDEEAKSDAIQSIFYAPFFLTKNESANVALVNGSETPGKFNLSYSKNVQSSYTNIKNNKLKCFPYNYLLVSNNAGGAAIYKYEYFNGETVDFVVDGVLTPGCSIRLRPCNYKGVDVNSEEGLNLGKYPICNWNSDVYTNWLTQNGVNIGLNLASGVGQIITGGVSAIGTGGAGAAIGGAQVVSGVSAIASQLAQIHQMSFTPAQSRGNTNCGDVVAASNNNTFTFYAMTINEEYVAILDKFFDMFGYKVNAVKTPNSNHRKNYWYTKTIDASIDGNVPMKYMQKIKEAYNNGITFWRHTATIGNYNQENEIL